MSGKGQSKYSHNLYNDSLKKIKQDFQQNLGHGMPQKPALPPKPPKTSPENRKKQRRNPWKRLSDVQKAFLLLTGGIFVFLLYEPTVDFLFEYNMQLKEGNLFTSIWKEMPLPLRVKASLFSIENKDQFMKGAKPVLKEHGPYVCKVFRKRIVHQWLENTVVFYENFTAEVDESESPPLDTRITFVNLPITVAMWAVESIMRRMRVSFLRPVLQNVAAWVLRVSGESLIETRTARERLEGRQLNLLAFVDLLVSPLRSLGLPIPAIKLAAYQVEKSQFGILLLLTVGVFGPYEHFRRTEDEHHANEVYKVNGKRTLPDFAPPCNQVGGSDGILFGTHYNSDRLSVYNPHLFRQLTFDREKEYYLRGVPVVKYSLGNRTFDMTLPRNRCFCPRKPLQYCDGWCEVSASLLDIPVGFSFPHFLHSEQWFRRLSGLKPDPDRFANYLHIVPRLGVPVDAQIALQVDLMLKQFAKFTGMESMPDVLLPLAILEIKEGIGERWLLAIPAMIGINTLLLAPYLILLLGLLGATYYFYSAYAHRSGRSRVQHKHP